MKRIYTRSYTKPIRYTPPPGYDGNTFSETRTKRHEPQDDVREEKMHAEERSVPEVCEELQLDAEPPQAAVQRTDIESSAVVRDFMRSLKDKIGREELVLILVMLLIASDGATVEMLILALLLIS